tara:strand:+ start:1336 stop:2676 length:1341 start_codon:yes stop_codon:yes gene_type:complete
MVYIGNSSAANFSSVTKDTFSGNGSTTAFTLSKTATTNGVAVYVENVRQIPTTAYAISGTTLTFTGAPVSGTNNIYVMHHNTPVSTATHPAAQALTATSGTFSAGVSGTTGTFTSDVSIDGGSFVFNESSADKDFRVESNGNTHMLFVDGGEDDISIGTLTAPTFATGHGVHLSDDYYVGFGNGNGTRPDFQLGYTSNVTRLEMRCGTGSDDGDIFITTAGHVGLGTAPTGSQRLFVTEEGTTTQCATFNGKGGSYATEVINVFSERAGNSAFSLYKAHSNDNGDVEFNFRGDGNGFCDGSFSGGGADYAEYFEWKDGNTSDENRLGYSVVLDGHQIRKATSDDNTSNIIGVISANPTIVGDNDVERWKEKYLKTDFGNYDLDENGDRKLNPNYDKSKTYVSREDRKEWDTVGLMGKLRLLKGQPTRDSWIKMRDISDTVEEWLVR